MTKKIRNLLFGFFTLIFLGLSAWVLLYAFGYQINWQTMSLAKTGMFVVKTNPGGALIYLNDEPQTSLIKSLTGQEDIVRTPAKISNLKPGTYNIRLELDGYWPWQKQLTIRPNESTYLEDVRLFRKELPLLLKSMNPDDIIDSAKAGKQLLILTEDSIIAYDLGSQTYRDYPADFSLAGSRLSISPDNSKVMAGSFLVDLSSGKTTDIFDSSNTKPRQIIWSKNNDEFFYQVNQTIWQYNIATGAGKIIHKTNDSQKLSDLSFANDYLLAIAAYPGLSDSRLIIINPENGTTAGHISLPYSDYEFINQDNRWINLHDKSRHRLLVIEIIWPWASEYNIKTFNHIEESRWINDEKLLYSNGFEIRLWQRSTNQSRLLTRVSDRIVGLIWHPHRNYIIFATDKAIYSLELDDRYSHNLTQLIRLEKIKFPFLNNNGNSLYFFSTIGRQTGLYRLDI